MIDLEKKLRDLEGRCDGLVPRCESQLHGYEHCRQVALLAGRIAAEIGADVEAAMLAGLLHDCGRVDDGTGSAHAVDSARLARTLLLERFGHLDVERICDAIARHADGGTTQDPLSGALWDADRLTLPRIGIRISMEMLSTLPGRRMAAGNT